MNYTFVNNNGNNQDARIICRKLPSVMTVTAHTTSKGAFYVAAVKNHANWLTQEAAITSLLKLTGNGKPLRIGFTGVVKFQINSILLQEIDANAENQVTVVYCDGGEYKAEFAAEGGALKTPVKDGKEFGGWYSAS